MLGIEFGGVFVKALSKGQILSTCLIAFFAPRTVTSCSEAKEMFRDTPSSRRVVAQAEALHGEIGLLVLGDSIAAHLPTSNLLLPDRVSINLAVGGDKLGNTEFIAQRVGRSATPVAIVLLVGTNDVNQEDPTETTRSIDDLAKVLRERFPSSKVHIVNILPKGQSLKAFRVNIERANQALAAAADRIHGHLIDAHAAFVSACKDTTPCELLQDDNVHPSAKGYALLNRLLDRDIKGDGVAN